MTTRGYDKMILTEKAQAEAKQAHEVLNSLVALVVAKAAKVHSAKAALLLFQTTLFSLGAKAILTGKGEKALAMFQDLLTLNKAFPARGNHVLSLKKEFPSLYENEVFMSGLGSLINVKQKNVGAAELLLSVLYGGTEKNTDSKGDILIDGRKVEIKYRNANIKATENSGHRASNKAAKELWGHTGKRGASRKITTQTLNTIAAYNERVYRDFDEAQKSELVKGWETNNEKQREQQIGVVILRAYKNIDQFDSIVSVGENAERIVIINDFDDDNFLKENLTFSTTIRGNSTQALGCGYGAMKV